MDRKQFSSLGGQARAARFTPERRSEIARQGWEAMVARRFGGDRAAAIAWFRKAGLAAQDRSLQASMASLGGRLFYQAPEPIINKVFTPTIFEEECL